jgi:Ca-activated chloride channel family protein
MTRFGSASLVCVALALAAAVNHEASADELTIVSPETDALVTGPVTLRAVLDPPSLASEVLRFTFMADGRTVCTLEAGPFECAWDAGSGLAAHHVRAVAALKGGRRLVRTLRTRSGVALPAVEVDLVHVTATVTDGDGRLVKALPKESFRILENGEPQSVVHFVGESQEREIVVAVDISGSMTQAMPRVREAVGAFLAALKPQDRVTLLAFNDSVFTLARREADPAARLRAVNRLAPWGGTALHDAILRGLDQLSRARGLKALVVFTDGEDRSSRAGFAAVQRRVERSDAVIYMIGQGRGTEDPGLKEVIERLARLSGGRAFLASRIADLETAFAEIVAELSSQYLLAYEPTRPPRDGSWRELRVELTRPGYRVRARQGYRAPGPAAEPGR